jgi:hypothetical protein
VKHGEKAIPRGLYCYTFLGYATTPKGNTVIETERCPYWRREPGKHEQESGYCEFLQKGDWMEGGTVLLWDQVKECGINVDYGELEGAMA